MQEEEQLRNSKMLDLLYVNRAHGLAPQILLYYQCYSQMSPYERPALPIDTRASGGMNGFLWVFERNMLRTALSSPIKGLPDIENNQVLNITYLNPRKHRHIPKPPDGVVMPKKILKAIDIKPLPVLWHEDNSGRRQQARERPQVPGAIAGPQLGEAAHRLVKNSLNIRWNNNTSHGSPEQAQAINRLRSAGPSGSGRYYGDDASGYYGNYYNHQGIINRPRYPFSSNGGQNDRQNFRIQERAQQYHEQFHNMKTGFHALSMEDGVRPRPSATPSPKTTPMILSRQPNSAPTTNLQPQFVQSMGPPIPPPKWFTKAPDTNGIYVRHQESALGGTYDKNLKKVYQVKTRQSQDMPEYGNQ